MTSARARHKPRAERSRTVGFGLRVLRGQLRNGRFTPGRRGWANFGSLPTFLPTQLGRFDLSSPVLGRFRPLTSGTETLCFVEVVGGAGRDRTAE
jgi:hypothetical protein